LNFCNAYSLPNGQGISVTEIQLARAYAAIANGGFLITPHVLNYITKNHKIIYKYKEHPIRILKTQTVKKVRHILGDVVKLWYRYLCTAKELFHWWENRHSSSSKW